MPLNSPRFSWNLRLQAVSNNNPPMKRGEQGEAVRLVQQALIDLGHLLPISTRKYHSPDGTYGNETYNQVKSFQRKHPLKPDGIVGKNTMGRLDSLLPFAAPRLPPLPVPRLYVVPGIKPVVAQPTNQVCWATVHAMMRSWKDQVSYDIRQALELVGNIYVTRYDNNQGLPSSEFGPFIRAAGMQLEPMANLSINDWASKLRMHGLLWVGSLFNVTSNSLHSRIIEGMTGNGQYDGTWMMLMDPWGGVRYRESFARFLHKYETAIKGIAGNYFQIRHF